MSRPHLEFTARVVIVGSGIAGAATAFELARAGAKVTILDSGQSGQATAAGAGIIQPWLADEGPVYELLSAGALYYPSALEALAEAGVVDVSYRSTGSLVVDADQTRLDEAEQLVRSRASNFPDIGTVTRLDVQEARALVPPLAPDLQALYIGGGARVDGRRLRAGLLHAAQRLGTVVEEASARVLPSSGGGVQVVTAAGAVPADAVVVAAGAWTNSVVEPLGYRLGVEPQRGQLLHLSLDGVDTSPWPSVLSLVDHHYMVAFDGGRLVVGATQEAGSGFDPRITVAGLEEVLGSAVRIAPGLRSATVLETRVGLRPLSDTGLPVIGGVLGIPGLFINTGFGAVGLTAALLAGAALAQVVLDRSPIMDLSPFAPPRLAS